MATGKIKRTCKQGHTFYKSSDCPACEKIKDPVSGFLALLSNPARNSLLHHGIDTIEKLSAYSEREILHLHGIGKASLPAFRKSLEEYGLAFNPNEGRAVWAKKTEASGDIAIKYHANGKTIWSKGAIVNGKPEGYWEWYRIDGTRKRSGHFEHGEPVGEWITYDKEGEKYKVTNK